MSALVDCFFYLKNKYLRDKITKKQVWLGGSLLKIRRFYFELTDLSICDSVFIKSDPNFLIVTDFFFK